MMSTELELLEKRIKRFGAIAADLNPRDLHLDTNTVSAFCQHVNEVQLPRLLTFRNGRNETLAICVRAGRIIMIDPATSDGLSQSGAVLNGQILDNALEKPKSIAAEIIGGFLNDTTLCALTVDRWQDDASAASPGIPPETLVPPPGQDGRDNGAALDQLCQLSHAHIRISRAEITKVASADAHRDALIALAEEEIENPSDTAAAGDGCVIVGGGLLQAPWVVVMRIGADIVVARLDHDSLPDVLTLWRGHIAQ